MQDELCRYQLPVSCRKILIGNAAGQDVVENVSGFRYYNSATIVLRHLIDMRDGCGVGFYMYHLNFSSICNQGKNIIVFYGSQTGTAEEFANRLSKDAQRYGMKGMAADPEEYDMVICIWNIT